MYNFSMELYQIILIIVAGVLLLLFILYFILCEALVAYLSHPKKRTLEWAHDFDVKKGIIPADMSYMKREPFELTARDGTIIKGDFSINEANKGIIVLPHGYSWNREGMLKYAQFYYKNGFSIVLYDQRTHGESTFKYTTMGYLESLDICDVVSWLREKYGKNIPIGIHGESMGAASTMMSLKHNPNIQFAIEDCGYHSLTDLIIHQVHGLKFLLCGCNIVLKIHEKYRLNYVNPSKNASESNIPMLIIHGEADGFVPFAHSSVVYEENKHHAEIYTVPNAKHAESYETDPVKYEEVVMAFINKHI